MDKFIFLVCIILPYVVGLGDRLYDVGTYEGDPALLESRALKRTPVTPNFVTALMKYRLMSYLELRHLGTLRPTRNKLFPFHPLVRFRPASLSDSPFIIQEDLEQAHRDIEEEKALNAAAMVSALNGAWSGSVKPTPAGRDEDVKSIRYGLSK